MKRIYLCVFVITFLAVCSLTSLAQTSYGTVAGSVSDATGAVVPGATVTITSIDTGESHVIKTTGNGGFRVEALGVGRYNVTVEAPGFNKVVIADVEVSGSVTTSVTPTLTIGATSDTIEVSGSSETLQTQSGEVSATLSHAEIADLPLSGLNAYNLATTLPGVVTVTTVGLTNGPRFSTNGSRPRSNNYLIEGQDNNDAGITGQGLQPENEEAVDSVSFLLNGNSAEFGRGGGAVSNLIYRSGTNQFHGAVWDRILNSSLNAVDHSLTYSYGTNAYQHKTKSRENIYGFRVGGPILKNKLFFFVSDQFDHYRATATLGTLILPLATPSTSGTCGKNYVSLATYKTLPQVSKLLQAYAGLASATTLNTSTCNTGNLPGSSNPDANYREIALGLDPVTNVDRGIVQFATYQRSLGNIQNSNEFVAKGDYLISTKDKLQLRYVRSPFTTPYDVGNFPSQLPNLETDQHGVSYNAGIVEDHTFSSNILNEFRLSYGRIGFSFDLTPGTYANPLLGPTISIGSITGFGIPTNTPQGRFHNTYQLQDALTIVHGNHSIKTGFDVAQVRVRDQVPFVFYGSQSYVAQSGGYTALANYIDDFSGNGASASKQIGSNLARPTLTNQGYYIQDHWKASARMAVDLGVRYEYYGAPFNYVAYPAVDPANLACFPCRVVAKPNFKNFAPRVGFAYTPFVQGKTVVRGAFGIFYDNVFTNIADNIQASAPNAASPSVTTASGAGLGRGTAAWSTTFATPAFTSAVPTALNSVTATVPNLRNPYTMQWNLAVEQQLPYSMSMTVAYIGSRSVRIYGLDYLNPTLAGSTTRFSNTRGPIAVHDNTGDGAYTGGTFELQRHYRSGALVRFAYTYAKAMDDVADDYTSGNYSAYPVIQTALGGRRGLDWGPSAYDHRQRPVLSAVYTVPKFEGNKAVNFTSRIVSNIGISGIVAYQSGSVINTQTGVDVNGDGITNDRPILENPGAPVGSFAVKGTDWYAATVPGNGPGVYCDGRYLNSPTNPVSCKPVLLSAVQYYIGDRNVSNVGAISRNNSYTRGIFQNDFTASRTFKTFERQDFLFRAECFNCMSHANTGIPAASLYTSSNNPSTTTFLQYAPTAAGGRTLRFFLRYEF